MSQKDSNSKCPRKTARVCNDTETGKAEQVCPSGTALNELQKEIERDLKNSERVLTSASNYKGNSSRDCTNRRPKESHHKVECSSIRGLEKSYSRLNQSPGPSDMKKASLQFSLPSSKKSMHSSNEHQHESHKVEIKKFSQFETSNHHHHHSHDHDHTHESREVPKLDEKSIKSICHLSKLNKSSSHTCELDQGLDFLETCCPKLKEGKRVGGKVVKLPEPPCLLKEQIEEMIRCETQDVESAWYLTSEEKRTYKKPCPKQEKAQMRVRALVEASKSSSPTCGKKYSPLEHPEPEDISPDTAAAMMFLQEQGVKMEECPNQTITRLFPDDPRPPLPEKASVSVVDPSQTDQKEMIEKSASVPSEGVSDSAYTRRMGGKGEDFGPKRSYDVEFAIGQSNREYVFVTQKPQRVNMIRFRGGSAPSWFPWYFSAFPDDEDGLKVASSPSGLFYKAWLYSNPENIPSNDVIVLD